MNAINAFLRSVPLLKVASAASAVARNFGTFVRKPLETGAALVSNRLTTLKVIDLAEQAGLEFDVVEHGVLTPHFSHGKAYPVLHHDGGVWSVNATHSFAASVPGPVLDHCDRRICHHTDARWVFPDENGSLRPVFESRVNVFNLTPLGFRTITAALVDEAVTLDRLIFNHNPFRSEP